MTPQYLLRGSESGSGCGATSIAGTNKNRPRGKCSSLCPTPDTDTDTRHRGGARFTMRVVSALSCFAAAGPLLHTPLPFGTTSPVLPNNGSKQLTKIMRKGTASMVFECDTPRPNSSGTPVQFWLQSECTSTCRTSGPALMTRGGVTAAPRTQGAYGRLRAFLNKRFFLLGAATMVASARFAPALGTSGGLLSLTVSKAGERRRVLLQ